jgi:holo-[acyl-carrier protein] synthase
VLRAGVDLIEVARIESALARHGERFLRRVFTDRERSDSGGRPASLAARFAAKEAAAKALGCGIGDVRWTEIEVVSGPDRRPALRLHGAADRLAQRLDLQEWALSLSHTPGHAIAFVVAL